MTIQLGPNNGLMDRGARGEEHYDEVMRLYRALDVLLQGRVKSRVSELPESGMVNGDCYIFLGVGVNTNAIVRYSEALATWEIFPAQNGWEVSVLDELDENGQFRAYFYQQSSSSWVARLASGGLTVEAGDERYDMKRKNNLAATTDPTATDDSTSDYEPLSRWINTTSGEVFICISNAEGAAVWGQATLTLDELGTAALANVGTTGSNLPSAVQVQAMIAAFQNFGPSSAATAGTKGFVPAPPATEVRRYLASDGTWQTITISDVPAPGGENVGASGAGVFRAVVDYTLQFRKLYSSDSSISITQEEGRIDLRAGGSAITEVAEVGDSIRVSEFDAGTLTLKGIKAGENISIAQIAGNLVFSASGGGSGGEGGATTPLSVNVSLVVYNAAEFTEEILSLEDAAAQGITVNYSLVPEAETSSPSYADFGIEVDVETLDGLAISGYLIEFVGPEYLNQVFLWLAGEPVFDSPEVVVNQKFGNLYYPDWAYSGVLPQGERTLRIAAASQGQNLSSLFLGIALAGSFDGTVAPSGIEVPLADPGASRGPYGTVQIASAANPPAWGLPVGQLHLALDFPAVAISFAGSMPAGDISAATPVSDFFSGDFLTEKVLLGDVRTFGGDDVTRTFLLGSGASSQWSPFQSAIQYIGVSQYGEVSPVIMTGSGTSLADGRIISLRALMVNTRSEDGGVISSTIMVSDDGGDSFFPFDYPSLSDGDVQWVVGYLDVGGTPGFLYEKFGGGYDIALSYIDNPFNFVLTDMIPMGLTLPFTQATCLMEGTFGIAVCDGVRIWYSEDSGSTWTDRGRVVSAGEETDGVTCVKIAGSVEGQWVAILSDGRFKYAGDTVSGVTSWGEAQTIERDGQVYEMVDAKWSGYDDLLAAVRYPERPDSSLREVRAWRTLGARFGNNPEGGQLPDDVRAWQPVLIPEPGAASRIYTNAVFGDCAGWTPPTSLGGPPGMDYYAAIVTSTQDLYGSGGSFTIPMRYPAQDTWFYAPPYPTPSGYSAVTRVF